MSKTILSGSDIKDFVKPITNVGFIMKSGARIVIETPLSVEDFTKIYNKHRRRVKIITDANSYIEINKKQVVFYHVFPIKAEEPNNEGLPSAVPYKENTQQY